MKPVSPATTGSRGFPFSSEAVLRYPKAASHDHCCFCFMLKFLFPWDYVIGMYYPLPLLTAVMLSPHLLRTLAPHSQCFSSIPTLAHQNNDFMSKKPLTSTFFELSSSIIFSNPGSKTNLGIYHLEFHYLIFEILNFHVSDSGHHIYLSSLQFSFFYNIWSSL